MTFHPELGERERAALDAWEPMEPPAGFADRVLAVRGGRRWLPYAVAAISCGAAAAIIAAILAKPGTTLPDAANVAIAPIDEIDAATPTWVDAAPPIDYEMMPIAPDAAINHDGGGFWVDGSYITIPPLPNTNDYDVEIEAGETFTVHTPTDAAFVKFRDSSCTKIVGAQIDTDPTFKSPTDLAHVGTGMTGAIVEATAGRWHYRVTCGVTSPAAVIGSFTVLRDDGTRKLPSQATTITVEPDGKVWRVDYASRIPNIIVKRPPGGERFHLLDKKGVDRTTFIKDPTVTTVTIDGATLTDQSYTYWFERGGVRVGLGSTLRVERDLTPQQISIEAPALDALAKDPIEVRGTVLDDWTITIDSNIVTIDAQHHFATTVGLDANHVVAIKARHRTHGIHYFIRRLRTP